ncbi:alpha/beta hydrolase [Candidatus Gottesmanbacteria bacterium]|nr:alpha/beta hydrolase [Candidatus Gottesmanbacteria bacterium]
MTQLRTKIRNQFGKSIEILFQTPGNDRYPTVILVSGFGMDMHEYNHSNDEIVGVLIQNGIATVQFTFSTFDTKDICHEISLKKRADELDDVVTWTKKLEHVDPSRIGIHATSFGVATTLILGNKDIKTAVFVSGSYFPQKTLKKVFIQDGTYNPGGISTATPPGDPTVTVEAPFWKSLEAFDARALSSRYDRPVLLIHGSRDTLVTTDEVQSIYSLFPNSQKKLKIFSEGDHGITDVSHEMRDEFLQTVVQWFRVIFRQ